MRIRNCSTVEVLTTLTQENGKLFMKLHQVEPKVKNPSVVVFFKTGNLSRALIWHNRILIWIFWKTFTPSFVKLFQYVVSKLFILQGASNFINAIKVAHLALKHRQNRNHKMRIVVFVGSPIDHLNSAEVYLSFFFYIFSI